MMQKGHILQFCCQYCQAFVRFSVFEIEKQNGKIACSQCDLIYDFEDETLKRQLCLFEALCFQLKQSEEILSQTSVGIYIGDREIKIPYKLLLTRLNSTLDLMIGEHQTTITFHMEPTNDVPLPLSERSGH